MVDLTSLFRDISLEPTKHVLEIEYPVRGLLPPDTEPLIEPPIELGRCEAPPHDQTRAGVSQSTCRIHIPTETRDNACDGFPDELVSMHSGFQSMSCGPGKSQLAAVIFYDHGYERDIIRLCLNVSLKHDDSNHYYTFEVYREQWQKIVDESESLWAKALDELMMRRSDRAYYHVRNRIAADYGHEAAVAEEAKWGAGWGGTRLRKEEIDATTVDDVDKLFEGVEL
jgi:hypothetical protein